MDRSVNAVEIIRYVTFKVCSVDLIKLFEVSSICEHLFELAMGTVSFIDIVGRS